MTPWPLYWTTPTGRYWSNKLIRLPQWILLLPIGVLSIVGWLAG